QAERTPVAVAVSHVGEWLSYHDLNARANQVAHLLRAKGVGKGSYVPVLMDGSFELVISLLSVMKAGAAFSPLDITWPIERLRQALDDLGGGPILVNGKTPQIEEELGRPFLFVDAKAACEQAPNPDIPV